MKLYVDVVLADDADAVVERVKIKGATEQEVFRQLATVMASAVREFAGDVMVECE